jgi:hypothetical protein
MTINMWAVLVCAVAAQVVGMIWYGQKIFGKAWGRVMGMDMTTMTPEKRKEMQKSMGGLYFLQFVLSIVTALVLALVLNQFFAFGAWAGVKIALLMWLGFIIPLEAGMAMWGGKPKKLAWDMFLITSGYQLVVFVVFGIILGAWM